MAPAWHALCAVPTAHRLAVSAGRPAAFRFLLVGASAQRPLRRRRVSTGASVESVAMAHHDSSRWGVAGAAAAVWLLRVPASVLGAGRLDRTGLLSWPRPGRTSTGQLCHLRPLRHRTASRGRHLDHRGHPVPAGSQAPTSRGDRAFGRCRGRTPVARSCAGATPRQQHRRASRQCWPAGDPLEPHPLEPVVRPRRHAVHRDCDTGQPIWAGAHPVAVRDTGRLGHRFRRLGCRWAGAWQLRSLVAGALAAVDFEL